MFLRFLVSFAALGLAACGGCVPQTSPSDAGADTAAAPDDAGTPDQAAADDADEEFVPDDEHLTPIQEPGRHAVRIVLTEQIVPSSRLRDDVDIFPANNNLDVVRHGERVYLAWRTAPDHFASPQATIHVASSPDEIEWQVEATFSVGRDVREPRFLALGEQLFLYMTLLGTDPLAFEPFDIHVAERESEGTWGVPESLRLADTVLWRTKNHAGTPYLLYYVGAGDTSGSIQPLQVRLDTTRDGRTWRAVSRDNPAILEGGVSETDFAIADDGAAYGVSRNDSGDEEGFGSKVCRSSTDNITDWRCSPDPRKFDSPRMFWFDGEAYLIARRNVTPDGNFDLGRDDLTPTEQRSLYQSEYALARKRCSIWRYAFDADALVFVTDLPSRGDTCSSAVVTQDEPGVFAIYNYSSPLDSNEDPSWETGQRGETRIYRHVVRFDPL